MSFCLFFLRFLYFGVIRYGKFRKGNVIYFLLEEEKGEEEISMVD